MGAHSPLRRRRRPLKALACLALVLISFGLALPVSHATFTASTSNASNAVSAGTVVLSDDDGATAMFAITNAKPGDNGQKCIEVSYTGTLASAVKLYVTNTASTLSPYLNMVIEQGTGGSSASCSGFSGSVIYTGTLSVLGTSFATGVGSWSPASTSSTQVYRIGWTLQDDYNAQGRAATLAFTWEARNT